MVSQVHLVRCSPCRRIGFGQKYHLAECSEERITQCLQLLGTGNSTAGNQNKFIKPMPWSLPGHIAHEPAWQRFAQADFTQSPSFSPRVWPIQPWHIAFLGYHQLRVYDLRQGQRRPAINFNLQEKEGRCTSIAKHHVFFEQYVPSPFTQADAMLRLVPAQARLSMRTRAGRQHRRRPKNNSVIFRITQCERCFVTHLDRYQ